MKNNILSIILAVFVSAGFSTVSAQHEGHSGMSGMSQEHAKHSSMVDTLKVYGNCDACKTRIEKAALKVQGVQTAEWNKDSKILKVTYAGESKRADIQKAVLKAGHDIETANAKDEDYNALPGCCKYRGK